MKRSLQVEVASSEPDPHFVDRLAAVAAMSAPAPIRRSRRRATAIRAAFAGVALSCFGTTAWAAGTLPSPADLPGLGTHAPAPAATAEQAGPPLAGASPSEDAPAVLEVSAAQADPADPAGPTTGPSGRTGARAERRTTHAADRRTDAETRGRSEAGRRGADRQRPDGADAPGQSHGHAKGDGRGQGHQDRGRQDDGHRNSDHQDRGHRNSDHQDRGHRNSGHRDRGHQGGHQNSGRGSQQGAHHGSGHGDRHHGGQVGRDHHPTGATRGDGHRHRR